MFTAFYLHGIQAAGQAREQARGARQAVRGVSTKQEFLECEVNRLMMICQALWELIKQSHPEFTDEDLANKVMQIDLTDGNLDGKVKRKVNHCTSCGRALNPRHMRCIYCGNVTMKVF